MSLKLIGKKIGMTQVFDKKGKLVPCTLISLEPNVVVKVCRKNKEGVEGVVLGFFDPKWKKANKPQKEAFAKAKVEVCRKLVQSSHVPNVDEFSLGSKLGVSFFSNTSFVDVTTEESKGKGFQGVMKLHGFSGGPAAHGSGFHRHAGSTGMRSTPGRCFPGGKRASQMGRDRVTVQSLEVVRIDEENNLLLVKGAVPGSKGKYVFVAPAKKKGGFSGKAA